MSVIASERVLGIRALHRQLVLARDGAAGELADVLFDDQQWAVRYLVVDNLGPMPRRDVLVEPAQAEWTGATLHLRLTRDELKGCPDLDEHPPVYLQHDMSAVARPADPHLRSAEIMLGFAVRGRTAARRLIDIHVDPARWTINSLLLDSGVWLPGKHVTLDPREVKAIDWIARIIELR